MKKLLFALLLTPIFAHSQTTQSDRWQLLYENKTANTQTYVDTQTIEQRDRLIDHENVYFIWIKAYSDFTNGKYHSETLTHMVFDMNLKQFGIQSIITKKDDAILANKQFGLVEWQDIPPESNGELIMNYLKKLHKQ